MSSQERRRQNLEPGGGPPASGGGGSVLDACRCSSHNVRAASHAALDRANSADHEGFLEAARFKIGGE